MRRSIYQTLTGRSYFLDTIAKSNISAYSLRQLSKTRRPLVRIWRDTDSAELDIFPKNNGAIDESSILSFAGAGSAFVMTWYDAFNNNNLTQSVTTNRPKIVDNGAIVTTSNGKVGVRFESTRSTALVSSGSIIAGYPIASIVSVEVQLPSKGAIIKTSGAIGGIDGAGIGFGIGNSTLDNVGNNIIGFKEWIAWCPTSTTYNPAPTIVSQTETGSNMAFKKNSSPLTITAGGTTTARTSVGDYLIGGYTEAPSTPRFSDCIVTESILLNFLNPAVISSIEQDMIKKYT